MLQELTFFSWIQFCFFLSFFQVFILFIFWVVFRQCSLESTFLKQSYTKMFLGKSPTLSNLSFSTVVDLKYRGFLAHSLSVCPVVRQIFICNTNCFGGFQHFQKMKVGKDVNQFLSLFSPSIISLNTVKKKFMKSEYIKTYYLCVCVAFLLQGFSFRRSDFQLSFCNIAECLQFSQREFLTF